uniref:Uncharacterized protein n=1 Tax=Equus caballus TaxID=9796 RepID=A0A3Q2LQF2_HORSE
MPCLLETEGREQKGCWEGAACRGFPDTFPWTPSLFPHVPSLGLEPCKDLRWPGLGLWASVSPFCNRLGLSLGPMLTDSTSISVIFQKAFQKCTSRFCVIRSNSAPRSSGSMAKRPLVKRELAVTPGGGEEHQGACAPRRTPAQWRWSAGMAGWRV